MGGGHQQKVLFPKKKKKKKKKLKFKILFFLHVIERFKQVFNSIILL
jgi:hypothetical protein